LSAARIFPRAFKQQQPHQQQQRRRHLLSDEKRKKESCKNHIVPADVETLLITCKECNKQKSISQNGKHQNNNQTKLFPYLSSLSAPLSNLPDFSGKKQDVEVVVLVNPEREGRR
jgi:hypothetical protein